MRLLVVLSLTALLAASTPASAGTTAYLGSPGPAIAAQDSFGRILAWPASPEAYAYDVFRVEADGETVYLGTTSMPGFIDRSASASDVVYRVVTLTEDGEGDVTEFGTKGECLSRRGLTGVAITLGNCAEPVTNG